MHTRVLKYLMVTYHNSYPMSPQITIPVTLEENTRAGILSFLTHLTSSDLPPISRVLLYGSQARDESHDESDIDIAVVFPDPHPGRDKEFDLLMALARISSETMFDTLEDVSALPIWENNLSEPEKYYNPDVFINIKNDGIEVLRNES